jgi:hypothetical protein
MRLVMRLSGQLKHFQTVKEYLEFIKRSKIPDQR